MVRWLVWTCGGLVVVGVVIRLFSASAADNADQAPAKAGGRPVSSTPASTMVVDPRLQFETAIQKSLMQGGQLVRPGDDAPPDVRRAYELALEAKKAETTDAEAAKAAAERVWEEKRAARDKERRERKAKADEKMKAEREKFEARKAQHQSEMDPDALLRRQSRPRSEPVQLPPAFVEDPANPVPKPPDSANNAAPAKR